MGYEEELTTQLVKLKMLLLAKHNDYGHANLKRYGPFGIAVRCADKLSRITNLLEKEGRVSDETILDTWRDLAGYSMQAILLMENKLCEEEGICGKSNLIDVDKDEFEWLHRREVAEDENEEDDEQCEPYSFPHLEKAFNRHHYVTDRNVRNNYRAMDNEFPTSEPSSLRTSFTSILEAK